MGEQRLLQRRGQITNATLPAGVEVSGYNSLYQLISRRVTPSGGGSAVLNMAYNYKDGKNNGQIYQSVDSVGSGETIAYQYDSLKRLISASSTASWSETYTCDG